MKVNDYLFMNSIIKLLLIKKVYKTYKVVILKKTYKTMKFKKI